MAISFQDVINRQVEISYTPPQNFFMAIEKLPELVFTVQQVQIPPISGGETTLPNRHNSEKTYIPGDGMDYSQLDITFLLDKEYRTYRSVLEWMKGINTPEAPEQYTNFVNEDTRGLSSYSSTMSNIYVFGSDAANVPLVQWKFVNAFPISLDGPSFDATLADIEYLTAAASFRFHYFEHQTYTNGGLNPDKI